MRDDWKIRYPATGEAILFTQCSLADLDLAERMINDPQAEVTSTDPDAVADFHIRLDIERRVRALGGW